MFPGPYMCRQLLKPESQTYWLSKVPHHLAPPESISKPLTVSGGDNCEVFKIMLAMAISTKHPFFILITDSSFWKTVQ